MITETPARLNIRIHDLISPEKCFDFRKKRDGQRVFGARSATPIASKRTGTRSPIPFAKSTSAKTVSAASTI